MGRWATDPLNRPQAPKDECSRIELKIDKATNSDMVISKIIDLANNVHVQITQPQGSSRIRLERKHE